jgi:adenosylcobinamide-phosphate synthase
MSPQELLAACALDALIGDPRGLPHPVRLIGCSVAWYECRIRSFCRSSNGLRMAGVLFALALPAVAYVLGAVLIALASDLHDWLGRLTNLYLAYTTLAWRDLVEHASHVERALKTDSLLAARRAVSHIVGRDTADLSGQEIVRATVETIAESASDGVLAPLFYLTIGGAPLALAYKGINTLDSMVGHRDERYRDFGWASARLDDLANWIPARFTAWLLVIAAWPSCGLKSAVDSWRIWRRDGHKHASPNSGQPEAAMAGALGVQLGGVNYYDGVPVERPRLGDKQEPLEPQHIARALRLITMAYLVGMLLSIAGLTLWN